jgi:hypothetical protein
VPSAFGQIKRIACSDDLNSKYIIFVASMNVDVSLVAAQPSRSGYPRIVDAPKEAVAANLAHTGEPALNYH